MYLAGILIDDVAQAGLVAFNKRRFNVFHFCLRINAIGQTLEDNSGSIRLSGRNKVTGRFRNEEKRNQEDRGGDDFHPEHPLIGLESTPEQFAGAAGNACKPVIADKCSRKPDHDHQLLQGCQASPDFCRRNFTDVCRCQNTCGTYGKAAENTGKDKLKRIGGHTRSPGADNKCNCGHHHDRFSPDLIGKVSGEKGTCGTAQQHRSYVETGANGIGIEGGLQGIYCAIDNATVKAE